VENEECSLKNLQWGLKKSRGSSNTSLLTGAGGWKKGKSHWGAVSCNIEHITKKDKGNWKRGKRSVDRKKYAWRKKVRQRPGFPMLGALRWHESRKGKGGCLKNFGRQRGFQKWGKSEECMTSRTGERRKGLANAIELAREREFTNTS